MSSTTWTRSGAADAVRPWRGTAERLVENQAESSTRPLVDSAAEHEVLERLLDAAKPPIPDHARRLSFLLATPFRYPPLPWGSRFGTRHQPSIWYGALDRSALFAEAAYYTFVRLEHSPAVVSPHEVRRTSFRAAISARRWIDWTAPRFADLQPRLRHPAAYRPTQRLGADMREAGVEGFTFGSARDREDGRNVGIFTGDAFSRTRESAQRPWSLWVTRDAIEIRSVANPRAAAIVFERAQFLRRGKLPVPAA